MTFNGALMYKALNNGAAVDQIIGSSVSNPYSILTFNDPAYDTGGYWDSSRNGFLIPAGVSLVRFTAQAVFMTNNVGLRQLLIQRSAPGSTVYAFFRGVPIHNTMAVTGTTTDIAFTSAVLPVTEGECYGLMPYQDSGVNVPISGGGGTFFGMEVLA